MTEINYLPALPDPQTIIVNEIPLHLYIVEDDTWFFSDKQVAKIYGISPTTIKRHISRNRDVLIEGKHWFKKLGKLPRYFPHMRLWTKEGLIKLGNFVKTQEAEQVLIALGVKTRQRTKLEPQLKKIISSAFEGILEMKKPYPVAGYKIDIYFPQINTAVEIDEYAHGNYDADKEQMREETIKKVIGCSFVRYNPHSSNENVGTLINKILKRAIEQFNR